MTEFDPSRSEAIRSLLVETVEQTPRRDHRRHVRLAVIAVLAALGGGLGTAAVAVALTGGVGFPDALTGPPAATAPATPTPTPTGGALPSAPAPAPAHPLDLTGDVILPHDVLTAPVETPLWTLAMPAWKQDCDYVTVTDVADGYALVQVGPTTPPEDVASHCDDDVIRMALSLVDTTTGVASWNREWSWESESWHQDLQVQLLGTSGRVLVSSAASGTGAPQEVLDLVSGTTLGLVDRPAEGWTYWGPVVAVGGSSADVVWSSQDVDADGRLLPSWTIARADPLALSSPLWTYSVTAEHVRLQEVLNGSSLLQVSASDPESPDRLDVLDVDSGVPMVQTFSSERRYEYGDGFTLRWSDYGPDGRARSVAGVDDAGNELWSRTSDSGFVGAIASGPGSRPGFRAPIGSTVVLVDGGVLEVVDGVTGESRWSADAGSCATTLTEEATVLVQFAVDGAGVLRQLYTEDGCDFDLDSGTPVDHLPMERWMEGTGVAVYELTGGFGTGGLYTYKVLPDPSAVGLATVSDAGTGAELWTRPISYDERWTFAGGRLVSITETTISGLG